MFVVLVFVPITRHTCKSNKSHTHMYVCVYIGGFDKTLFDKDLHCYGSVTTP